MTQERSYTEFPGDPSYRRAARAYRVGKVAKKVMEITKPKKAEKHKGLTGRGVGKTTKPGTFPVTRTKKISYESGIESPPIRSSLHEVHKVRTKKRAKK